MSRLDTAMVHKGSRKALMEAYKHTEVFGSRFTLDSSNIEISYRPF